MAKSVMITTVLGMFHYLSLSFCETRRILAKSVKDKYTKIRFSEVHQGCQCTKKIKIHYMHFSSQISCWFVTKFGTVNLHYTLDFMTYSNFS
jgi:hypothetical protein